MNLEHLGREIRRLESGDREQRFEFFGAAGLSPALRLERRHAFGATIIVRTICSSPAFRAPDVKIRM